MFGENPRTAAIKTEIEHTKSSTTATQLKVCKFLFVFFEEKSRFGSLTIFISLNHFLFSMQEREVAYKLSLSGEGNVNQYGLLTIRGSGPWYTRISPFYGRLRRMKGEK